MKTKNEDNQTGAQRLLAMYRYLSEGGQIRPTEYANEWCMRRQSIYHQINLLKRMGFPIANLDVGVWALGLPEDAEFNLLEFALGTYKQTGAQRLVQLYRTLVSGEMVRPQAYARDTSVKRQTVYRQLDLLSQAGIPVTNISGKWTLAEYLEYGYD